MKSENRYSFFVKTTHGYKSYADSVAQTFLLNAEYDLSDGPWTFVFGLDDRIDSIKYSIAINKTNRKCDLMSSFVGGKAVYSSEKGTYYELTYFISKKGYAAEKATAPLLTCLANKKLIVWINEPKFGLIPFDIYAQMGEDYKYAHVRQQLYVPILRTHDLMKEWGKEWN